MNAPVLRRLRKSSSTVGSVPTFRIVVFGQSGVGKTAMSVRFVTKRFIGEYDPTLENIYQYYHGVGGNCVLFEIMDTAGQEENDLMMEEKIRWADAFILVYAINDQTSFAEIPRLKFTISHTMAQLSHQHKQIHPEPVIRIVGNKTDLEPDRMVSRQEGESLAKSMNCAFREISVRDGFNDVMQAFEETYKDFRHKMSTYHSLTDINGTFSRKKSKSFKYVDRVPRMQGRRRNYMSVSEVNSRPHVFNDVVSDIMTSKIDEDSEMSESFPNTVARTNGHYHHRSTMSLPGDGTTTFLASSQSDVRPPGRTRRNAVIGLGNGLPAMTNGNATNHQDADGANYRRQSLIKASRNSENSIHSSFQDVRPRDYDNQYDANNNNADLSKANRRCRSQENIDLNSHSMLENFTKRAVSFGVTNGLTKRVS